jgi:trehalose/maltose transport system permease protein
MPDQHVAATRRATNGRSHLTPGQRVGIELVSAMLVLMGLTAIVFFLLSVNADDGIREAVNWTAETSEGPRPSLVLAFLDSFGIVVPVLVIILGMMFIGLGLRLRTLNINAAHWARTVYLWLAIFLGAAASLNLLINGAKIDTVQTVLPLGLIAVIAAASLVWLDRSFETLFMGLESYRARETRTAWNLLIPALAVLILVAARPLEQSFITSLTDKVFASDRVPRFVGLRNYDDLLSLRVDEVECRREDDTSACRVGPNGEVRWATIDRGLLEKGYRTAWNIHLPLIQPNDRSIAISGQDRDWLRSMWTTLQFTVSSVTLELVIGLFIALVVNSNFKGRGFMRAVMLVPWAIPTVISARLWELILKDSTAGIVNRMLMDIGLLERPRAWLVQTNLQVPSAVMVDVWKTSPFMALLLLAGLQTIPADLYEAAAVDGANRFRQFLNITLPMLRPTIAVALVFRTLDALRVFDLFNVLYGRQQLTMATYNYETLVNNQADGYASAVGVLIFLFIFAFAVMYVRLLGVETK